VKEEHVNQLKQSAISDRVIEQLTVMEAVKSINDKEARELGLYNSDGDCSGLLFTYFELDGRTNGFNRIRFDDSNASRKYMQPAKSGSHLYIPPSPHVDNPETPILVVEGEKKTLSAYSRLRDVLCVGVGGVWNWIGKKKSRELISTFKELGLFGRKIYLCFDSDTGSNRQCANAEAALARALRKEGATVRIIQLPVQQKGLDDWFLEWGSNWKEELRVLWRDALSERSATDMSEIYSQIYTVEEMLTKDFPTPTFFVGDSKFGIVAEGMVTFVHGSANLGKTYLSTQMAFSIAAGIDFLGFECGPEGAHILILQGEMPPGLFSKGRIAPICDMFREEGIDFPETLKFLNWGFNFAESSQYKEAFRRDSWLGIEKLENILDEHRPAVLFIDPLQSYHNLVEGSNDQNRELMKKLKGIAIRRNMGIVMVDHDVKSPYKLSNMSNLRGASNKADLADTILGLRAHGTSNEIRLFFDKVRYINCAKPKPYRLRRQHGNGKDYPFFEVVENE